MDTHKEKIIEFLLENYSSLSKKDIVDKLNLSWSYIQKLACLNNIKRTFVESKNDNKYNKLINYEDNTSLYWIGFILADGHIANKNNIQINLSIKDKIHILKLKEYLGDFKIYENDKCIRATITDRKTITTLSNDFGWVSNKTKNPIKIPNFLSYDGIFSLIVGFIDGDGYINKKGNIILKCDKSWKELLEYFYFFLTNENKKFNLTKENLAIIYINKKRILIDIKQKVYNLGLPILERKWSRIIDRIIKNEKYDVVKSLLIDGFGVEEIKNQTNFSLSFIYKVKKIENLIKK
jgi:hypothetical protein